MISQFHKSPIGKRKLSIKSKQLISNIPSNTIVDKLQNPGLLIKVKKNRLPSKALNSKIEIKVRIRIGVSALETRKHHSKEVPIKQMKGNVNSK